MPYKVTKDEKACSASKPWAVQKKDGSKTFGCHATKADAEKQMAALYANETSAAAQAAAQEYQRIRVAAVVTEPLDLPEPVVTYESDGIVLATLAKVPLVRVGMKYPASTGPVDFSFQHLSAAVSAGSDPAVPRPRVKLGHTDPRYNSCECPSCKTWVKFDFQNSYVFDGEPGFGFVENTALSDDGGTVVADLIDMPLWLAKIAPVAFASRSVEGWFGYEGPNNKTYDFVLTDLALLGVCFPGCLDLPDLPRLYGAEMPDFVVVQEKEAA